MEIPVAIFTKESKLWIVRLTWESKWYLVLCYFVVIFDGTIPYFSNLREFSKKKRKKTISTSVRVF